MARNAIRLKNYSFRYLNTEQWVLKNTDFSLAYGELIVLSGLSGEGKSTLLSSINGIIPHVIPGQQEGDVFIDGESISGKKPSEISLKVGSVLQNPEVQIIHSKVEDEIAFGCENLNMQAEEISITIEQVCKQLDLEYDWFTKTLSGGQKQRLITAAILAMKQKILVFDEPLANLDLEGAHTLLKLLKRLTEEGYAVLLVEHRLDVILPYADKIAWIKEGKVEFFSKKEEALNHTSYIADDRVGNQSIQEEPCFVAKDLSFRVPEREILQNLNFTINKGERVVILGENGCGKTTLMRLIARMLQASSGSIEQYVENSKKKKPKSSWFKKVGFVYQNPNYQLFMSNVLEEVMYQSTGEAQTNRIMEEFRLQDLLTRHPQSLSEGQKRRLTIACVLAMEPEVLLLDEPTVGQDYEGLKNIIYHINEMNRKSKNTMITITHDFRCAKALADKIIWMKKGRIYKIGGPELADEYFFSTLNQ